MSNVTQKPLENQGQFVTVFNGEINQTTEMLCNARELHKFLGVGRDFNTWIKERIKEYGFVKNQDFVLVAQNRGAKHKTTAPQNGGAKTGRGGHNKVDYHITLDMAKELAMVEKNAKGREIRRYFIQMEKQALQSTQSLTAQITETCITLQHFDENLSKAGWYLATHGKQTKPQLKAKLTELLQKAQPYLPFVEFGGAK
ncbi:antA/AntB antirepressor family protein [Moraxella bovis]|uniref:AntA/AntB antirepressor family protein n=1 Tax=Moraxella bovis TaxID=476 RepID=A0AAQ2Q833_MORBO|nr:antA/AntB antirepressor family protein [Moraxella bovis]UYZ74896.1 antA/AntB antirepressor family protein [Moraxella bovis]UYZ79176.1 antA/AntB antirepressor family protein [Moraxella bovis]UYZ87656.1 antA/AntB antirepressor family protein [Moraxella bovis]UYZ93077.1 antA/AntB antirepressor family protein [Moraxella bovis]UYZ97000.1 antA/AntB antirepressor family protein [Moraxella bovis]